MDANEITTTINNHRMGYKPWFVIKNVLGGQVVGLRDGNHVFELDGKFFALTSHNPCRANNYLTGWIVTEVPENEVEFRS